MELCQLFFTLSMKYSVSVSNVANKLYLDTEDYQYRYTIRVLHLTNLYKLCRVCDGKVITKCGYINVKTCSDYVDLLRTCFGILPSEDKK